MRAKCLSSVLVGLLVVCAAGRVWSQSLGDVAKKEEERRKRVAAAGKVYTNKDLGSVPPATAPPSGAVAASGPEAAKGDNKADASKGTETSKDEKDAAAKKSGDAKEQSEAKGQAYWSTRRKALQEALDRDSTFADALQSRINALATDFINRDDPAQRSVIERDRQKASSELERLKKQMVDDRKALADLEEEARRANVPPGWLR